MVLLAASRTMAMQGAKARVPLIKFRYGAHAGKKTAASTPPAQQASTPRPAQTQSTTLGERQLPARFCRQPISQEEIDYINRGGPA